MKEKQSKVGSNELELKRTLFLSADSEDMIHDKDKGGKLS
jgi:hypothetical protein